MAWARRMVLLSSDPGVVIHGNRSVCTHSWNSQRHDATSLRFITLTKYSRRIVFMSFVSFYLSLYTYIHLVGFVFVYGYNCISCHIIGLMLKIFMKVWFDRYASIRPTVFDVSTLCCMQNLVHTPTRPRQCLGRRGAGITSRSYILASTHAMRLNQF